MSSTDSYDTAMEPGFAQWRRRAAERLYRPLVVVMPVLVAGYCVMNEYPLTAWAGRHEAIMPLAVIVLLLSLLSHRLRNLLTLTLCYGVAFMAVRDIGRVGSQPLPQLLNYDFIDKSRPAALLIIAGLASTSAFMETFNPGTVWARRCYFGAAALYFLGLGIIHVGRYGSWKAVLLCVTGVTAVFGCIFADRIVSAEVEPEADEMSDEAVQGMLESAHRRTLLAKEWHEPVSADPGPSDAGGAASPSPLMS